MTSGSFDPRVLTTLVELGYDRTWAAIDHAGEVPTTKRSSMAPTRPWRPGLDVVGGRVAVGEPPIDLGGIGKGLALRWAAAALRAAGSSMFLIEAGGDCVCGPGPEAGQWRIGVEDPADGVDPVAVVEVANGACATSSTRLRGWRAGGRPVHHLIDPRTGEPGGGPLRSVSVVGADPADAEVWSKVLFLEGERIADAAEQHDLAALWVDAHGRIDASSRMAPHIIWRRP
jgi:thiamine biosynthesis lipoprotein